MIDFACKQFNINDIIKCGLGLTKAEFKVMLFFLQPHDSSKSFTTQDISTALNLNLTTVQKSVKKLTGISILSRRQKNLASGGYIYTYRANSRDNVRNIMKDRIHNWSLKVEKKIDEW